MPTYQYACTACDERLEAVQTFTDAPLTECPACGGALRKVFSAVGVVFKGSGFYKTDSRGSAGKKEGASTASTSSEPSGSSDSSSTPAAAAPAAATSTSSSTSSTPASKSA